MVIAVSFTFGYVVNIPVTTITTETSTIQSSTTSRCFQGVIPYAYDDVVDEGYFPSGETCWQIKCSASTGRLIKSIVECENLSKNSHITQSPTGSSTESEIKCHFNGKTYNSGKTLLVIS